MWRMWVFTVLVERKTSAGDLGRRQVARQVAEHADLALGESPRSASRSSLRRAGSGEPGEDVEDVRREGRHAPCGAAGAAPAGRAPARRGTAGSARPARRGRARARCRPPLPSRSPSASCARASRRSALIIEKSRTIGAVPASTGASTSMAPRASRSASWIAARAARVSAYSRSAVRRRRQCGPSRRQITQPHQRLHLEPAGRDRQRIGCRHQRLEPLRLARMRRGPPRAVPARDAGSLARSARAAPWRARRSVEARARRDPATACASSNRPCADIDAAHRRQHHGRDRLGQPPVLLHDLERLRGELARRLSRECRPAASGEMAEAAHLHVRPPVPPGELQAFLEVPLGIVAGAGPELDDAEGHERHGSHVVRSRDLAHGFGLDGLEQRPHLAHDAAESPRQRARVSRAVASIASKLTPAFFGHLRRMALGHGDVRGGGVERRPITSPYARNAASSGFASASGGNASSRASSSRSCRRARC